MMLRIPSTVSISFLWLACWIEESASSNDAMILSPDLDPTQLMTSKDGSIQNVILKLYSPHCSHCQEMASEWTLLAMDFFARPSIQVAQINCVEQERWCASMDIVGLPSIFYGDPSYNGIFLKEYNGEKTYDEMSKFTKTILEAPCTPGQLTACTNSTIRDQFESWWTKPIDELRQELNEYEQEIKNAENKFDLDFRTMQLDYSRANKEHMLTTVQLKRELDFLNQIEAAQSESK